MTEVAIVCIVAGALLSLASAIGLARFPDTLSRAHALGVASTLGILLVMVGVVVAHGSLGAAAKAFLTVAFMFVTAPVGSHMLGRSAYLFADRESPLERDDLEGHLDEEGHDPTDSSSEESSPAS